MLRSLAGLELEEKILNGAALIAALSVLLPWIAGDWPGGESVSYSGFGYSTSFIGLCIFLINVALLLMTAVPLFGGPVIMKKRRHREMLRLWLTMQSVILVIAAFSVLKRVSSLEFTRLNVKFGVYICFIASLIALFEAVQRYIGFRKTQSQETFHHPEDEAHPELKQETLNPPPPPPPPPAPLPPEDHRYHP